MAETEQATPDSSAHERLMAGFDALQASFDALEALVMSGGKTPARPKPNLTSIVGGKAPRMADGENSNG